MSEQCSYELMIIIHSCSDIAAILTVFIFKSYMYFLFQKTLN